MYVLGINAYHADSSACLLKSGKIVAAAEEERFRRVKHWAGLPTQAIAYCLADAGIALSEVPHIAINTNPKAALGKKIGYALRHLPEPKLILDRLRNQRRRLSLRAALDEAFPGQRFGGELHHIEHHLAHIASAFLVSPFEEAATVSVDGFGDFCSAAWGVGKGDQIDIQGRVHFPHSLGVFYQAITQYLGFPNYGDEYKVMGLAPYGRPDALEEMRRIVRLLPNGKFELNLRYFRHHVEKIDYAWTGGSPHVGALYSDALAELLGVPRKPADPLEQRHKDIARSAQAMYEEAFFHLLEAVYRRTGMRTLALAGGCAMNSVANGKIARVTPFKRLYVQSAAGDAGGAIGAAAIVWSTMADASKSQIKSRPQALAGDSVSRPFIMEHAYLGNHASNDEIARLLNTKSGEIAEASCSTKQFLDEDELCRVTAKAISDGLVIGWFQGRMEWGPRALGNRSILCDPRRANMKDILNLKIKRRESFRPFAPSILREVVGAWFEEDHDVPFMMQVYQIRPEKRVLIPAVTHVDGTGRLQTVNRETNPRYYTLISAFQAITNVPIVLNTSLNENEPVACRPQEALECFLRTNMDVLVLNDWMIQRVPAPVSASTGREQSLALAHEGDR